MTNDGDFPGSVDWSLPETRTAFDKLVTETEEYLVESIDAAKGTTLQLEPV